MTRLHGIIRSFVVAAATLACAVPMAGAKTLRVDFAFGVPVFASPQLDPIEQLLADNGISTVTGTLSYDSADAVFVTTDFTFASNIDALFDTAPTELAFALNGNLNQIRWWEVVIGGVDYSLELTALDPDDPFRSPQWFGAELLGFPNNTFDLAPAVGTLTTQVVPVPASLVLLIGGLTGLGALGGRRVRRRPSAA